MHKKHFIFSLIAGLMLLAMSPDAHAKKGFYIGLGVPYNTIEGDFKGTSALRNSSELIILPGIDGAVGLDILFGYGISRQWAVELNFMGSTHEGNMLGLSGDVDFFSFSINGKYNFSPSAATQQFLMFGISGNSLTIHDGSQTLYTSEVADGTLSGSGINLGAGMEHYFSHLSVRLGLTYRFVTYTSAEGVHDSGGLADPLDGSGFSFMLSTAYHF